MDVYKVGDSVSIHLNDGRILGGELVGICPEGRKDLTGSPLVNPHIIVDTACTDYPLDDRREFPRVFYAGEFDEEALLAFQIKTNLPCLVMGAAA